MMMVKKKAQLLILGFCLHMIKSFEKVAWIVINIIGLVEFDKVIR